MWRRKANFEEKLAGADRKSFKLSCVYWPYSVCLCERPDTVRTDYDLTYRSNYNELILCHIAQILEQYVVSIKPGNNSTEKQRVCETDIITKIEQLIIHTTKQYLGYLTRAGGVMGERSSKLSNLANQTTAYPGYLVPGLVAGKIRRAANMQHSSHQLISVVIHQSTTQ